MLQIEKQHQAHIPRKTNPSCFFNRPIVPVQFSLQETPLVQGLSRLVVLPSRSHVVASMGTDKQRPDVRMKHPLVSLRLRHQT
jgi:hypothetical protein